MSTESATLDRPGPYGIPPGQCIYCGISAAEATLSDEHIIPHCLGGDAYLQDASCPKCAGVTSYLEGVVGRQIFGTMRAYYQIQSRKKKLQMAEVSMVFTNERGEETRTVKLKDAPPFLLMIEFGTAGIFTDSTPSPNLGERQAWIWYSEEATSHARTLRQAGDKSWSIQAKFQSRIFARFLAKTAHAFAVAQYGTSEFQPLLPDVVRGIDPNVGYVVGGAEEGKNPDPPLPAGTHRVAAHNLQLSVFRAEEKHLLVAQIQLFTFTGAPSYYVVVGIPSQRIIAAAQS